MDFWDKFARYYDVAEKLNGEVYRQMRDITVKLTPFHSKVLECAAGTGELSLAAAAKAESVLCTDNSAKMLETARLKAEKRGVTNVEFERANIFHLDAADETYDAVIAGNILHLLRNPKNAVRELYRVTKRGGRLLLPTFMTSERSAISGALLKAYQKLGFEPCTEFTPRSYVFMLKGCNLGKVRAKLIKGTIPCCYAVIIKE